MNNDNKQLEIEKLLLELSKVNFEVNIDNIVEKFGSIYSDSFRHEYNKLFAFIIKISKNEKEYNFDTLLERLETLKDYISQKFESKDNIIKSFNKLYDHLSLEITRYQQYNARFELNESELKTNNQLIEDLGNRVNDFKKEFNIEKNSIADIKNQLITILGIFASIVLTFSGGLSFTTNAFNSIACVGIKDVIILSLVLGIIFTIVIYLLTYVIAKVNNFQLKSYWILLAVVVMAIVLLIIMYKL